MQNVELSRWLPYDASTIYRLLTDPQTLATVVGRIQEAHIVERQGETGKVAVLLDLPARNVVQTVGDVEGIENQELSFQTYEPFPLKFSWILSPAERGGQPGTEVQAALGLDLSVFGIPMAGVVIRGIIQSELEADMDRLEARLAEG